MSQPTVAVRRVGILFLLIMSVFAASCSKKEAPSPRTQAPKPAPVDAQDLSLIHI